MSEKKIPIESTWAEFWKVVSIPEPAPRCSAGRLFMTPARLGDMNRAVAQAHEQQQGGEGPIAEVDREQFEEDERDGCARASRRWRTAEHRSGPTACPRSVRR